MLLPILRQIEQKTLVERSARGLRAAAGVSFGPSGVGIFPEFVRSNHTWWAAEATPPAPDVIDGEIGPGRATRTNSSASRGDPRGIWGSMSLNGLRSNVRWFCCWKEPETPSQPCVIN